MALEYKDLDDLTRKYMIEEFDTDFAKGVLYISPRLTTEGAKNYPSIMREALEKYNDEWLADTLRESGLLRTQEQRRKPSGGYTMAKIPITAAGTLAKGEFNRFYCRGVCRRSIELGSGLVKVYRAKDVQNPRPESEMLIGKLLDAKELLNDLKSNVGVDTKRGIPGGPNSGLSVCIP